MAEQVCMVQGGNQINLSCVGIGVVFPDENQKRQNNPKYSNTSRFSKPTWRVMNRRLSWVTCLRPKPTVSAAKAAGQPLEVRRALWDGTVKEVKQGALSVPFFSFEVTDLLGGDAALMRGRWLASVRLPVFQKDKMRPMDDFCRNLVNSSVTTREKIKPDGGDALRTELPMKDFMI
eukprot:1898259-Amphidinium_carterae.1